MPIVNPISVVATTARLRSGEPWLQELLAYLDENFDYVKTTIAAKLPDATFFVPDATYLGWIDLGSYFPPDTDLTRYFAETAGVLIEGGNLFIADADGYIRSTSPVLEQLLLMVCPRSLTP